LSRWLIIAAVLGFTGVAAGAFGAHALQAALDADRLALWDTAARYQMLHAPALLAVAWLASRSDAGTAVAMAGWTFTAGVVLFSGSLYLLAAGGDGWLGAVTPVGGALLLAGWTALAGHGLVLVRRGKSAP
jgi:uncharacterized membrane protein YgdD (TMEM256/DUF423 family)